MCIIRRHYYWSIALKQKEHNNRWCGNTSLFLFTTTYTCGNDNAMITNLLLRVNLRPLTGDAFFPHRDAVVGVGNGEDVPDDRPAETPDGGFEVVEEDGVVVIVVTITAAFGPDVHFAVLRTRSDLLDVGTAVVRRPLDVSYPIRVASKLFLQSPLLLLIIITTISSSFVGTSRPNLAQVIAPATRNLVVLPPRHPSAPNHVRFVRNLLAFPPSSCHVTTRNNRHAPVARACRHGAPKLVRRPRNRIHAPVKKTFRRHVHSRKHVRARLLPYHHRVIERARR